jgi:septal ring factor EnvC (AmiA/AmiB activator)
MKKLWKILLAIGGAITGIFILIANKSNKKEFKKKINSNNEKIDSITKKTSKLNKKKSFTKSKIKKTNSSIKGIKSKVKNIKNAKSIVDKFEKKYRTKK